MRIVRPLVRKATKTVVYPLVPAVPVVKSVAMGTRRGNQARADLDRQTELMEQQTALLRQQLDSLPVAPMVTADGVWVSYDGGETYQRTDGKTVAEVRAEQQAHYDRQPIEVRQAAQAAGWVWVLGKGWVWPKRSWPRRTPPMPAPPPVVR